jgi:uncharacterized protein
MKKQIFHFIALFFVSAISPALLAQNILGEWSGALKVPGGSLLIVFHISEGVADIYSTMDSPDQGAFGIAVDKTIFTGNKLTLEITAAKIKYEGILGTDEIIKGTFNQGGQSFEMDLSRGAKEKEVLARPQEPKAPFPYYTEDVQFTNTTDNVVLSGTLTLPSKTGIFPVVVLISGSGPQDRNESLLGHKPFLVLADYLTRKGIGVLRYDDRGVGKSTGKFDMATSADFAKDTQAAIAYLKTRLEINSKQIGLIGHSEGGLIAPMVATQSKDIAFIVLLAGPGTPIDELMLQQSKLVGAAQGATDVEIAKGQKLNSGAFSIIKKSTDQTKLKTDLTEYFKSNITEEDMALRPSGTSEEQYIQSLVNEFGNVWMQYFIQFIPANYLTKVRCPVLALNGSKDLQVPAKENLEAIQTALKNGGNKNFMVKELPGMNHLFQECSTGAIEEYAAIEQTFSPVALAEISNWIYTTLKLK